MDSGGGGRSCCQCCTSFIFTLGLTALFLWLSLRSSKPSISVQLFEIPILNKTLALTKNTTVFVSLRLANGNKDKGINYDDLNLTLNLTLNYIPNSTNRDRASFVPIGNSTVVRFYQGHKKKATKKLNFSLDSFNWTGIRTGLFDNISSSAVFRRDDRVETHKPIEIVTTGTNNLAALWARFQEENVKNEKLVIDHAQQITAMVCNLITKDLLAVLEKTLKEVIAVVGPAVAQTVTPTIEKTIASAITDSFQRGVGDKAVDQLDKSVTTKIEATVARQLQAQSQTSGKQALQDALKSSFEALVIPAFEMSCKSMFEQVDATFQKGIAEHTNADHQQFDTAHSPLALTSREDINAASSVTQTLSGELADDGQRKLIALAAAGVSTSSGNQVVEAPVDPTKELKRLVSEHKYEEAFTGALQRSDVHIVSWLCSQVDMRGILSTVPQSLSQVVLLSLLQQLSCDIHKETSQKLGWMTEVAAAVNPADAMISPHVRPIFDQVYQILNHQRSLPTMNGPDQNSIRLLMHVINSLLMACK